jgi:hypothetical protein
MKSSLLRLFTVAAVALAITSVSSFAGETDKKKGDESAPCCPNDAPKSQIFNGGKCGDKKDDSCNDPAKTEPVKGQIFNGGGGKCGDKKDGENCPPAPTEAPKA